jgi:uncharacterized protein
MADTLRIWSPRPYAPSDADAVLALNQSALDAVSSLDLDRLAWLAGLADRCLVVPDGDRLAGFAVMLGPGTDYDSVNYAWFGGRYDSFGYLDRIVVDPSYRRTGVGSSLYDATEAASARHGRMTLEVYVEPPNDASLAFHRSRGYAEVGRLGQANGKTCGMFAKELPSTHVEGFGS